MAKWAIFAAMAAAWAASASAESADYYRGGWRTDPGSSPAQAEPQVYEFVIRDHQVSGVACSRCADGTTLARIEGTFDEKEGIRFSVRHLAPDGSLAAVDHAQAKLGHDRLVVSGARPDGVTFTLTLIKDPRGPTPGGYPQVRLPPGSPPVAIIKASGAGGGGPPPAYVQPAPWRRLTAADVLGVWIGFGVGMEKQYFLIGRDGDTLFGLACGRCDNPYTMGALDHFAIHGQTLEFDIEHQDWGEGDHVPFVRHVTAHIAMNELRMDARRTDAPGRPGIVASLIGPIAIEATRGNQPGG